MLFNNRPYSPGDMAFNHVFFTYIKCFWSFLHDFNLLNPNPLSARHKSLSNFVQTQKKQDGRKKREAVRVSVSAHVSNQHKKLLRYYIQAELT